MDMNATPDSDLYNYMEARKMISAHKFEGKEPEYTTNVNSFFTPNGFKETIDYLWATEKFIKSVKSWLPDDKNLLPNENFPSDHYWMKFEIKMI